MAKLGSRFWLGGVLLTAATLSVGACGDDDMSEPQGGAGSGGSGGKQPIAGQAGSAQAGASAGQGGNAGQGGEAACVEGLQVVKVVDESTGNIISWPGEHRIGVHVFGQGISIFELGDDGNVTLIETLDPEELGLTAEGSISSLTRYGKGFLVEGATGAEPADMRIVIWQPDAELETVPYPEPPGSWLDITAADPEIGIAGASREGVRLATFASDTWTWSAPFEAGSRRSRPLALESDRVLLGIEEADRFSVDPGGNAGGAAAGGAGGAAAGGAGGVGSVGGEGGAAEVPTDSPNARVEWWNLQGQRLETHEAFGNPQVAVKVSEGWLIGETNSFWGSYQAAIELLPNTGALQKLTKVRVTSAGDGTDGAYDLALLGQRLLVANCESGLRVGDWSTKSLTLSDMPGPWHDSQIGECSPRQIETVGDFAVIGGENLVFARACE